MWLVWTIAWTIFTANPVAAFAAEQQVTRTAHQQADIDARLAASARAVAGLKAARSR